MKDFNQLCCEKCWHTTDKPCEHFISAAQKDRSAIMMINVNTKSHHFASFKI